jgi:hypothetical protein
MTALTNRRATGSDRDIRCKVDGAMICFMRREISNDKRDTRRCQAACPKLVIGEIKRKGLLRLPVLSVNKLSAFLPQINNAHRRFGDHIALIMLCIFSIYRSPDAQLTQALTQVQHIILKSLMSRF